MTEQAETMTPAAAADELEVQALDVVVGGLTCRKAGGTQQDFGATAGAETSLIGLL